MKYVYKSLVFFTVVGLAIMAAAVAGAVYLIKAITRKETK